MRRRLGKLTCTSLWLVLAGVLLLCSAPQVSAQDESSALPSEQDNSASPRGEGVGLLRRLNLTPEQVAQIREIRQQSETEGRALVRRMNVARRALNEAIYSEEADETLIRERANELAEAQSAVTRMRAQVEWKIRRVLTPTQLSTLRELRQRARRNRQERRRDGGDSTQPANTYTQRPRRRPNATNDNPSPRLPRLRRRGLLRRQP